MRVGGTSTGPPESNHRGSILSVLPDFGSNTSGFLCREGTNRIWGRSLGRITWGQSPPPIHTTEAQPAHQRNVPILLCQGNPPSRFASLLSRILFEKDDQLPQLRGFIRGKPCTGKVDEDPIHRSSTTGSRLPSNNGDLSHADTTINRDLQLRSLTLTIKPTGTVAVPASPGQEPTAHVATTGDIPTDAGAHTRGEQRHVDIETGLLSDCGGGEESADGRVNEGSGRGDAVKEDRLMKVALLGDNRGFGRRRLWASGDTSRQKWTICTMVD
ncbi:MAG: hypothetical protein Q9210_004360 [Variospora velana]